MTQQQLIEAIKRHAPELGEPEIREKLDEVSDMFCEETRVLEGQWSFTTNPSQMYYDLDDRCIGIFEVNYESKLCDKLMNVRQILIGR